MAYTEKIIDLTTGKETIRPYTKEEIAEVEAAIVEMAKIKAEADAKEAAKAALLERLGITAEEATLLLG